MTQALEKAFAEVAKLPAEQQDRFARWILEELEDEQHWDKRFARSQEALGKLAVEARGAIERGESEDLDPAKTVKSRATELAGGNNGTRDTDESAACELYRLATAPCER
jgi:hypothetical protein